ncbi:MAG: flagellar hook-length control protein FliK [Lachnospiraceae bacterium]|nr:flagellar hook-length control protein FliK [Lachnospiraceae bacterium]
MMAISTQGIGRTDVGVSSKQKADKKQEKAADAFASFMNLAAPQQSNDAPVKDKAVTEAVSEGVSAIKGSDNTTKNVEKSSEKMDTNNANNTDDKTVAENVSEKTSGTDGEVTDSADESMDRTEANASGIDDVSDSNTYKEVIDAAITELRKAIMELLGIGEEEFDELLERIGFSVSDLMKLDNLNGFVLGAENATSVDVLVNENLGNLLKNAEMMLDNLTKEYDITDVDLFISEAEAVFSDSSVISEATVMPETEAEIDVVKEESYISFETTDYDADKNNEADVRVTVNVEQTVESKQPENHESNSFDMNKGQTDSKADHVLSNLTQALNDVANADAVSGAELFTDTVSEADIVRQIIDEIEVNITRENTSLELQLNPEHLGKVQISVSTRNGVMQAQIVTESEAARHAVEASIASLKETFDNKELKVDAIEVMVGTSDFFNGNTEQQTNGENNRNTANVNSSILAGMADEDEESAEQLEAEMMQVQGNTVSYTA